MRTLKALVHHLVAHPIAGILWAVGGVVGSSALDDAAEWVHRTFDDPFT